MSSLPGAGRAASLAAAALIGVAALSACSNLADSRPVAATLPATTVSAARTWAVECAPGNLVQQPRTFTLTCADANESLGSLAWHGWGQRRATATGKLVINTCTPTCVAGRYVSYPVDAAMSRRVKDVKASASAGKPVWLYTLVTFDATGHHPKGTPGHGRFRLPAHT